METVKKIFAIEIYIAEKEIKKRWFVRIKVPDYVKGCFKWQKCYGDINKYTTVEERLKACVALAKQIERDQEYKTAQGGRKPGYINESFYTDIIYQFNQQLQLHGHLVRKSTFRKYKALIQNLERWLIRSDRKGTAVGAFSNTDARQFLSYVLTGLKLSNESYNAHLRLFKSLYTRLIAADIVTVNPFAGIKGMRKQSTPALYFQNAQITQLKKVISEQDPQLWLFVQFIYYCFIRPGELRHIRISDIFIQDNRIMIRPEISKNGKLQYVSIPDPLLQQLITMDLSNYPEQYFLFSAGGVPGADQLGENNFKIRHQAILKRLKYNTRHKLYSWKHTGAIACARAGVSMKDLQLQLRHHSLDQVNQYLASMLVYESDFIKNKFPVLQ